ncbi:MAG: hypothetical protein ACU0DU_24135 [Sagittula sp.]|uniref:hypothetical protein n=1 Tax=Sagittula sp. TaxID=2038081 RepID=UPI0040597CD1
MSPAPGKTSGGSGLGRFAAMSGIVFVTYVLCHGLTALLVTPLQHRIVSEVTVFASLAYLPHGVRVMAVWIWGWRAVPALMLGAYASELLFTPEAASSITEPVLFFSILVGALSALLGFEALRIAGLVDYAGRDTPPRWPQIFLVGLVTSVLNSLGQSFVFSGQMAPEHWAPVMAVYALGDVIGLCLVVLGMVLIRRALRAG